MRGSDTHTYTHIHTTVLTRKQRGRKRKALIRATLTQELYDVSPSSVVFDQRLSQQLSLRPPWEDNHEYDIELQELQGRIERLCT